MHNTFSIIKNIIVYWPDFAVGVDTDTRWTGAVRDSGAEVVAAGGTIHSHILRGRNAGVARRGEADLEVPSHASPARGHLPRLRPWLQRLAGDDDGDVTPVNRTTQMNDM